MTTLTDTEKTYTGLFCHEALPLYTARFADVTYDNGRRIFLLPDGRAVYAIESGCGDLDELHLEAGGFDSGDNQQRKRVAPQPLDGITKRMIGAGSLAIVGTKQVGWLNVIA